ncbi:unnamed protein product, partial [Gulo gulo]
MGCSPEALGSVEQERRQTGRSRSHGATDQAWLGCLCRSAQRPGQGRLSPVVRNSCSGLSCWRGPCWRQGTRGVGGGVFFPFFLARLGRAWQPACAVPSRLRLCGSSEYSPSGCHRKDRSEGGRDPCCMGGGGLWLKAQASRWWGHPPAG